MVALIAEAGSDAGSDSNAVVVIVGVVVVEGRTTVVGRLESVVKRFPTRSSRMLRCSFSASGEEQLGSREAGAAAAAEEEEE